MPALAGSRPACSPHKEERRGPFSSLASHQWLELNALVLGLMLSFGGLASRLAGCAASTGEELPFASSLWRAW